MSTQADSIEPDSAALGWGIKTLMLIGGISVSITLGALTPVLPLIDQALARTPSDSLMIKLLVTVVGLTMVVGAPIAGFLIDAFGMRKVVIIASLAFAVAGTAGLYLNSLPALFVSRLLVGAAAAAIATVSMTLINSHFTGTERAKWMGGHVAVATLGGLSLSPLAGLLGEVSWRAPFALYGLGLLIGLVAFIGTDNRRPAARPVSSGAPSERLLAWFPVRYAFLALCLGSITYLPVVYMPFRAREVGVSSPFLISLVLLADTALTILMASLFGKCRQWISSRAAFVFSFACSTIGMLVAALSPSITGIFVGMMVFGLGLGWFVPNLMTAAARCVRADQQGRTVGLVKAAHYVAAPLCTVAIDPVTRQIGPSGALFASAGLSFVLLVLFAFRLTMGPRRGANDSEQALAQ